MNRDQIRTIVLGSLTEVAPEADPASIDPSASLRDELDIDSMDFLRYVKALHTALHVDVPERDYARLDSVDGAVSYLEERLA